MTVYRPGGPANEDRPRGPALSDAMSACLARNWWAVLLRGLLAIVLGVLTLALPAVSLASLVLLFAVYMLADGVLGIVSAIRAARRHERWGWLVFEGVLDIAAGVAALVWPGLTIIVFVILVAAWAIVTGIALLAATFRLSRQHGRWLMGLAGVLSLVWGILLIVAPIGGALILMLWIGAYALVFGITLAVLAFRLRARRAA
ncbi:MAG TPA: HdeD family acid-resistance protein [Dongiaceae bacterium]|nr:HdeD family acid-resistance protein [Dongiaceae bacterium]